LSHLGIPSLRVTCLNETVDKQFYLQKTCALQALVFLKLYNLCTQNIHNPSRP